jgi:hypothetical protein
MDDPTEGYADEHRPLAGYAALTLSFGAAVGAALVAARATGRELPERIHAGDLVLSGVATQKVARLLAQDRVLSFVRAPFTRYEGSSGHGEVSEEPRGRGLRLAAGELVVCPYCVSQWIAGGFAVGFVFAPRTTRWLSAMWTAQALADTLNLAYSAAEQHS